MADQGSTSFDTAALRDALENRDAESLTGLFREDAECIVIDKNNPPSKPLERRGRDEIAEYNRYFLSSDKKHRLEKLLVSENAVAYADTCEYDDGTRVYCNAFLELENGKISRQVCVQAWDE